MKREARRSFALGLVTLAAAFVATWLRPPQQDAVRGGPPEQRVEQQRVEEAVARKVGSSARPRSLPSLPASVVAPAQAPAKTEARDVAPAAVAREQAFDEDEGMNAYDNTSEQADWRDAYATEHTDEEWTTEMKAEISGRASVAALVGRVRIDNLECRETVCRMYLQFADQHQAEAYIAASHPAHVRYEYQSLDPHFNGTGVDASHSMFEVLVKRPRPEGLATHDEQRSEEDELSLTANAEPGQM